MGVGESRSVRGCPWCLHLPAFSSSSRGCSHQMGSSVESLVHEEAAPSSRFPGPSPSLIFPSMTQGYTCLPCLLPKHRVSGVACVRTSTLPHRGPHLGPVLDRRGSLGLQQDWELEPDGWLQSEGEAPGRPSGCGAGLVAWGRLSWSPATLRRWEGLWPLADPWAQQLCPWEFPLIALSDRPLSYPSRPSRAGHVTCLGSHLCSSWGGPSAAWWADAGGGGGVPRRGFSGLSLKSQPQSAPSRLAILLSVQPPLIDSEKQPCLSGHTP